MKNAPDQDKAAADDVTEFTCDEDGVFITLKQMSWLRKFSNYIINLNHR